MIFGPIEVQFFYRYFFSKRSGSVVRSMARISWLATMIGVFSLIIIASIMNGFNRSIRTRLLAVQPHVVVTAGDGGADPAVLDKIKNLITSLGLKSEPFIQQDVIVRSLDGRFSGGVIKGTTDQGVKHFMTRLLHARDHHTPALDDLD